MYYLCTLRQPAYCVSDSFYEFFWSVPLLYIARETLFLSDSFSEFLGAFFVHRANPLTAYLTHYPSFFMSAIFFGFMQNNTAFISPFLQSILTFGKS